jgi:CRP-like cAMP-binding protein
MAQGQTESGAGPGRLQQFQRVGRGTAFSNEIFGLVGRSLFFAEFSREDISNLATYMDVYRVQTNQIIIRETDGGDFMLLLIEGAVNILKKGLRGEQQHMTKAGPGMTLGEMSMIDGEPRFATCIATEPSLFAVLHRDDMAKINLDQPSLGSKILVKLVSMLAARLRQTSSRLLQFMERGNL